MNRRKAFTLVELSVSMAAGGALMILAIGMLHQSMSLASTARGRSDQQQTLNRLAREFRVDVHRAAQCIVVSPASMRLVMSDDSQIRYEVNGSRIRRIQQLDGDLVRRESFDCGAGSSATLESQTEPARALLTVVRTPHPNSDQTRVDRQVAAVVGRLASHETAEVTP